MPKISYQAIFFDEETIKQLIEVQGEDLPKKPRDMHCTFKFKPSDKEVADFSRVAAGKSFKIRVVGYASDGKNSGFLVELPDELEKVYTSTYTTDDPIPKAERIKPHITVSMSEDATPADTRKLDFKPIEPFEVSGVGGFFVTDKKAPKRGIVLEPIEPDKPDEKTDKNIIK